MSQHERIATLLASGLPAASVSSIVGISPARISQLQKESAFLELLAAKQAESLAKDQEELSLSAKYLEAEHVLLKQVVEMAPVSELRDVTAALRVVAERQEKAKSRMNPVVQGQVTLNQTVQLLLPSHATPELQFSAQREVIAIENRNLAPLPSAGVLSLFKQLNTDKPAQLLDKGDNHDPIRSLTEAEGSSQETLPAAALPSVEARTESQPSLLLSIPSIPLTPTSAPAPASASSQLAAGARRFLDSLHPAPFAESF